MISASFKKALIFFPEGNKSKLFQSFQSTCIYDIKVSLYILILTQDTVIKFKETKVGSLIRNRFLQIALKLLSTLLCNFATHNHIEIVRFWYNQFFSITFWKYSSGTCPLHPMGNVEVSCVMEKHLSIMIVANIYANWLKQANNSRNGAESKVKVTKKVIKCQKIKCHNFDFMSSGETPARLWHLVVKILAKNYSAKIVNKL